MHEVVRQMKGLGVTGGCTSDEKRPLMTYSEFIRILSTAGGEVVFDDNLFA
jgi:hypothetical protein